MNLERRMNLMLNALKRIAAYSTPKELRQNSQVDYGLDYGDALEMAYENILQEAKDVLEQVQVK